MGGTRAHAIGARVGRSDRDCGGGFRGGRACHLMVRGERWCYEAGDSSGRRRFMSMPVLVQRRGKVQSATQSSPVISALKVAPPSFVLPLI